VTQIGGSCSEGFEAVVHTFATQLADYPEGGGAGLAITAEGELVVDVWGGEQRPGVPWARDTLVVVFSVTKGATTLAIQKLVDRGDLTIEAPIAHFWPEFAANGKQDVTVEQLLTHTAGLGYWDGYQHLLTCEGPLAVWRDADLVSNAIASSAANSAPGEQLFYHALTFGWIAHGLIRALTSKSVGALFMDEVSRPLELDFHIGLSAAHERQVADLLPFSIGPHGGLEAPRGPGYAETPQGKAVLATESGLVYIDMIELLNTPEFHEVEQGASNGIADARSVATMYGMLANDGAWNGRQHLTPEVVEQFARVHVTGTDANTGQFQRRALGYVVGPSDEWSGSYTAYGHQGAGGNLGYADPESRTSLGFVTNRPLLGNDRRWLEIGEALRGCLKRHV
jgi:CubicO group peptidase (beta-lactamase class C family)